MPLPDTLYCAQQIKVPPQLPDILKNFSKAAIRTQPNDLLRWSAAYFHALAKGECLPVKERFERNVGTGLTPGLLKILHKQMSSRPMCSREELQMKWKDLGLPMEQLKTLLSSGSFSSELFWIEFFALGCRALGGTLESSLKYACEILTNDEEGGPARIPFETFVEIYTFLAHLDGALSPQQIENFLKSLEPQVNKQRGMVQVSNFCSNWMFGKVGEKAQQIKVPPQLPDTLKNFSKEAIRTQPNDLLQWSAAYFHALDKGECLPVKERFERNVGTGLTPGLLKILHKQMSSRPMCSREELQMKWKDLGLPMEQLKTLLSLGCFSSEFSWIEFFALGCTALGPTLESSLKYACEILTNDEEGGPARIPFETFVQIYTFLARLDGALSPQQIENFLKSLEPQVNKQSGMIQVSNFCSNMMFEKVGEKAVED